MYTGVVGSYSMLKETSVKKANWFEIFDRQPIVDRAHIDWSKTLDFKVQSAFIVRDITDILAKMRGASDEELLSISQHCFNLLRWVDQMEIMGLLSLSGKYPKFRTLFLDLMVRKLDETRRWREPSFSVLRVVGIGQVAS